MTVCKAEKCIWRKSVGNNQYFCPIINCPNAIEVDGKIKLKVKWLGLEKRLYAEREKAKRNMQRVESDE